MLAIYDDKGNFHCQYKYDAWGNCRVCDSDGNEIPANNLNIGNINPIRYRGYYWDKELNLYYLQSRYYDPALGRFISPDDTSYLDPESVCGLNLYAYCANNPVMAIDPEGTSFIVTLIVGAIIAGIIAGTVSAVSDAVNGGSALDCLGSFVGGFIGGAVLGAASILGGGLAVGAFTATTASLLGTGAFLTVGTFLGGMGAYYSENGIKGNPTNLNDALTEGALTFTQGLFSFGIGAAMGAAGFYNSLKPGKGFMDALKTTNDLFMMEVGKGGIKSIGYGTMAFFGENWWAIIVRTFMKNIFTFPWNLIKP